MTSHQPDYPLDYDWLAENVTTRELAAIIACDVSSANGDKLQCHCSHHPDEDPSCTVDRVDGRTVVHCFGCELSGSPVQAASIVWGVEQEDAARRLRNELLALRNGTRVSTNWSVPSTTSAQVSGESRKPNLTLEEYSKAKLLRKESVAYYGVQEELRHGGTVLAFRCRDLKGNIMAIRYRLWMKAPEGSLVFEQEPGKPVYPFGVNQIPGWLNSIKNKEIVLVEGESDALTLWSRGYPAIGIPGADLFKVEWADLVTGFESVFVWQEHGAAAHQFVRRIGAAIPDARVLHDDIHDDPSALHIAVGGDGEKFKERFGELIAAARPISEVVQEIDIQQVAVNRGTWSEPLLPDAEPEPDPYPTCDLPYVLYRFVKEVAESTQTSTDMVLMATLSTVSACVAGKAEVAYNDWTQPLQLWTGTIADSGVRKSPVFRLVTKPVRQWEAEEKERTKVQRADLRSRKASLEKRLEALERKAAGHSVQVGSQEWKDIIQAQTDIRKELEDFPPVGVPRVLANDATPEALVQVMADNSERIFVGSSEADVLKILGGMYSNQPNTGVWKAGYDSDFFINDRVGGAEPTSLNRPALAVTLMLQGIVLQELRNKRTFVGEGVLGRFLFAVPATNTGYRKTGRNVSAADPAVLSEYSRRIKTLLSLPFPGTGKDLPTLAFTQDALDVLSDLEAEIEKGMLPGGGLRAILDWAGKLFGKVLRVAGVLHLLESAQHSLSLVGGGTIGVDSVLAAADIARASVAQARAAYGVLGTDESLDNLQYVYRRYTELLQASSTATRRDLFHAVKNRTSLGGRVSSLDSYIKELEDRDVLRQVKSTGTGRPSIILIPNPALSPAVAAISPSVSFGPFGPVTLLDKDSQDVMGGSQESFGPFGPVHGVQDTDSAASSSPTAEKIQGQEGQKKKFGKKFNSPDPTAEEIQSREGGELMSDTPASQDQKDQNPDDPDPLPPTTELF